MPYRFAVKSIEQTIITGGYHVVVTTFFPCHLWMRWTYQEPHIHKKPILRRGLRVVDDVRFCFTAFTDNEQLEAGDTYIHTFVKIDWACGAWRWFYFHGTINGQTSPSTSAIFKKQRLVEQTLFDVYPDPHPEVTTVDGWVKRDIANQTWYNIRTGPGTHAYPTASLGMVVINTDYALDTFWRLQRYFMLFDTTPVPDDADILSASIYVYIVGQSTRDQWVPKLTVVNSWPTVPWNLAPGDYHKLGTEPLCDPVLFTDLNNGVWNEFPLNEAGIAAIAKMGITRLGLREYEYDCLNIHPTYVSRQVMYALFRGTDYAPGYSPLLRVRYHRPC